jgi:hypothetical protein
MGERHCWSAVEGLSERAEDAIGADNSMISGVVTQGPFGFQPRNVGLNPFDVIANDDWFGSAVILSNIDRRLQPGFATDSDAIFASSRPQILVPAFVVSGDNLFSATIVARSQILLPLLHIAADTFRLPAIAIPGILQSNLYAIDDVVFSPFISTHGSLRPALYSALDVVFAPKLVAAQTLQPTSRHLDPDSMPTPAVRFNWIFAQLLNDSDVHYVFAIGGPPTTFDGVATEVALTNGNLTGMHTNSSTSTAGARSTANKTTGKFYFEVTMTSIGSGNSVGLIAAGATYTDILNLSVNCTVLEGSSGNVFSNDGFRFSFGSGTTAGTVIGVAVDLGARLAWFRRGAGNWNNNSSNNPATGVGGVAVEAGLSFAPVIVFNGPVNDSMTANFGQSTFANAAPSGFLNWTA